MAFLGMTPIMGPDGKLTHVDVLRTDWSKGIVTRNQLRMTQERRWAYTDGAAKDRLRQYVCPGGDVNSIDFSKAAALYAYIFLKYHTDDDMPWPMGEEVAAWNRILTAALRNGYKMYSHQ